MSNEASPEVSSVSSGSILAALNWRYAVQSFDADRKIPDADWQILEEALRLAPSSFGVQPWRFLSVTDQRLREKLVEHSWGQAKVAASSHLLVIAAKKTWSEADTEHLIHRFAEVRGAAPESLEGLKGMINGSMSARSPEEFTAWAKRQCYIALGFFLSAAALLRIDAGPMEGFIPEKYDEVLGLTDYTATVIAAAGYRDEADKYAHMAKVRFPASEVVEHI